MTVFTKRILAFVGVLLLSAGIAWLSGYNFDKRSPDVAFCAAMALVLSLTAATFPFEEKSND